MDNDFINEIDNDEVDVISYEWKIEETPLFLEDNHVNAVVEKLDDIVLDKPTFIVRQNPETWGYEGTELTPKILDFLKEIRHQDLDYDIYYNYSIRKDKIKNINYDNENMISYEPITEDKFINDERDFWEWSDNVYDNLEKKGYYEEACDDILNAVKDFHNMKWHNGEEFYKIKD